jgi:NAD(P)-dependent dehydrogenase (short-subunit alcohol dehydrogenase family)
MGGLHGYGRDGATAPLGGAISGFTKAYRRERPDALAKVIDFAALVGPEEIARILVDEALTDPGVVEVGYRDGLRWTVTLEEQPAADGGTGLALGRDTVFLVTGAAGGITAAIVTDLARASAGTFYLLDLVPRPDAADPKIALFRTDRERLKLALIEEMRARGEKPTPVVIDRQLLAIERSEAALRVIHEVEQAGGGAHYRAVNLLDPTSIEGVVDEIRQRHGRIDVLLHAGGIEISHALPEKSQDEFDRVFDVKAEGFFNLLKAAQQVPIGATVVFSSVAGRFGNAGQIDYSAANGFLCAASRYLRCVRPATRAIAVDWSAWAGIGMATRGSIPKIMEAAGIEMLSPEIGVPTIRRELTTGSTSDEIVVGGRLGVLMQEWDATGGLDPDKVRDWLARDDHRPVMVGAVSAAPLYGGLAVQTLLNPEQQPFLYDHQIEGTPVLPGVMGAEAFAELASLLAPDWAVADVEQVQFLLPFKFFHKQPAILHFSAVGRPGPSGDVVVEGTLRSRVQPKPDRPVVERVHFKASVRLSRVRPSPPRPRPLAETGESRVVPRDEIYKLYFHGPAYKVLDQVRVATGTAIGVMAEQLPPDTAPALAHLVMAPRLIELCFQTAGILEVARKDTLGLPTAMRSVTVYRPPEEAKGRRLFAVVQINGHPDEYDARVVDEIGNVYVELEGYRTIEWTGAGARQGIVPEG